MTESVNCPNCNTPLKGVYCYHCGQSTRGTDRFFLTLVNEAFEDIFSLNSRVWKTLGNLLFRPGFLSTEYFAGRRVRYIPPVRLYFTMSIMFFLVFALYSFFQPDDQDEQTSQSTSQEVESSAADGEGLLPEVDVEALIEQPAEAKEEAEEESQGPLKIEMLDEEELDVSWLSPEEAEHLKQHLKKQAEKVNNLHKVDPGAFAEYAREVAPIIVFCLLPLVALLLKLFYVFKGMYYTQHLVLAVHDHCFVFLWLTLYYLLDWAAVLVGGMPKLGSVLMQLWCVLYLWRSLRVVYGQGRAATTFKFLLLGLCYLGMVIVSVILATVFGIMII